MDLNFYCPNCRQELEVDSSGAGSEIACPQCGQSITIPELEPENIRTHNPIASSAAAKEEKHFQVPVHDAPGEALIQKAAKPLEVAAREEDRKVRLKTFKRGECMELGHDVFDKAVSDFLEKIGEHHVVSMHPISYSHIDAVSQKILVDYGLMIFYKG